MGARDLLKLLWPRSDAEAPLYRTRSGDQNGQLHLCDLDTLTPLATLEVADEPILSLAVSPDGNHLAIATLGDVFEIPLDHITALQVACSSVTQQLDIALRQADTGPRRYPHGRVDVAAVR